MEELTELMVLPDHQRRGIGRQLLETAWPGDPSPEMGRVVVAAGSAGDLSLYTGFGVMPVAGHWHMRQRAEVYLEAPLPGGRHDRPGRARAKADRAVTEWKRLEPSAVAHGRRALHEFFGRDRTCLAMIDPDTGEATSLCWVSMDGDIGPAIARSPGDLVPVVLAALDRVAMTQEPEYLSVFTTTLSWWLLRRLRTLGFAVYWPSWVLCSVPLPGLGPIHAHAAAPPALDQAPPRLWRQPFDRRLCQNECMRHEHRKDAARDARQYRRQGLAVGVLSWPRTSCSRS